jgi:hypothetical protein
VAGALLAGILVWTLGPHFSAFDLPVVVRDIQRLNELVSVKYTLQKVVALEEQKHPVGTERLLLIVQAEVLAGIDLSQISEKDVKRLPDGRVAMVLPPPKIIRVVIDDKETKVWDRSITWWTPWVPYNKDLERQARLTAKEQIEKAAIDAGILDQAKRSADASIRTLLETLGVKAIVLEQSSSFGLPRGA